MYMASLHRRGDGGVVYVKGSSEALLQRCVDCVAEDGARRPIDVAAARATVEQLAANGLT